MNAQSSLQERILLVVEDDFFLADDVTKALRECGARVIGPAGTSMMPSISSDWTSTWTEQWST
jgi:hypothetical protein